nr:hypothetical protein [Tanacetum cinerariifolium]
MVNLFSPNHVNDLPKVKPNQPEPALVDKKEEPEEEEEFEDEEEFDEEEPQKEEEDIEVDIKEEENEPELTFSYVKADHLNPMPPASNSEFEDVVEGEDTVELEVKTVSNSVHEVDECCRETTHALFKKKGKAMDKYYGKLIADLGNEVRCGMGEREAVLEDIIKEFDNAKKELSARR